MSAPKLSTSVAIGEGGMLYRAGPRPKGDPKMEAGAIADEIRQSAGKTSTIEVALESIVSPGAVRLVLATLKDYLQLDMEVLKVHGRVVVLRDKRRKTLPSTAHLATALIFCPSAERACDDFTVRHRWHTGADEFMPGYDLLYVRLLTAAQCEAALAAELLDEMFNAQLPEHALEPLGSWSATVGEALMEDIDELRPAVPRIANRKKKIPEGAATFVMRAIEKDMPTGEIEIERLVDLTEKIMPPKIDSEGKNRSKKYIRAAIEKLVGLELLYLHDKTKVSLTALVTGDE